MSVCRNGWTAIQGKYKMGFDLISDIRNEVDDTQRIIENCEHIDVDVTILCEEADRWIGGLIGAINAKKNPFEEPGNKELLAGLMTLADEDNREALNIDQKKFDLIQQFVDKKEGIKKYVQGIGRQHAKSIVDNLDDMVVDREKRADLKRKLFDIQTQFSRAKEKMQVGRTPGITRKAGGLKLA